jgi:hypothetical protein
MSGFALRLARPTYFSNTSQPLRTTSNPAFLRASLRELPRLLQSRQVHLRDFAHLRRIRRRAPTTGAVGWREVVGGMECGRSD